jgi:N-methylhydantoinase A
MQEAREVDTPLYRFEKLRAGNIILGPALIARDDTTIVLGLNDRAEVDAYQNLILSIG